MSVKMKKHQKQISKGPDYPKTANGSSKSEKPKDPSEGEQLDVGEHFMVRRHDDSEHPSEIVHKRFNDTKKLFEYLVHYDGYDRRLDEWVPRDRIMNSRNRKRRRDEINHVPMSYEKMDPTMAASKKEHEAINKIKYISKVQLGMYEIDTWYFSPFPGEYQKQSQIFICEYCLKYCKLKNSFIYHLTQCTWKEPPGVKVYHKESLSIWEVDSSQQKLYCQNLSLMAKLFLNDKTIYFDVEPFLFYILWNVNKDDGHFIGYFSKEKESLECYNVACLLIMPQFQKKGYGKLLIAFSYELSKLEGLVASPEEPLSDLGKLSYTSYWSWTLLEILKNAYGSISIESLSTMTSITQTDIISTLQSMNLLKYCKDQHVICVTPEMIKQLVSSIHYKRPRFILEGSDIKWTPKK
ncbi:unnamed protein product [Macrosiphum euphorbiae]|uniref:Histone acetyltransferase n=1 Tax=Macrosiphum euphorbiae TaxID=13131 RepID=A0AAV0XY52_9HEMI|nr:unnamed protein product [Macrosiphum euphorbiae]